MNPIPETPLPMRYFREYGAELNPADVNPAVYDPSQERFIPVIEEGVKRDLPQLGYRALGKAVLALPPERLGKGQDIENFKFEYLAAVLAEKARSHQPQALTALESYKSALDSFMLDNPQARWPLWAGLAHLFRIFRRHPKLSDEFQEYIISVCRYFEELGHMVRFWEGSSLLNQVAVVQRSFVDSLTAMVKNTRSVAKSSLVFASTDYTQQFREYKQDIEHHVASLKSFQDMMLHRGQTQQVQINTKLKQMMEQAQTAALLEKMERAQATARLEQMMEVLQEQISQPNRSPSTESQYANQSIVQEPRLSPSGESSSGGNPDDEYITYINTPQTETLERLRSFLSEETSYIAIDLLDRDEVVQWIESHTSSILCIEGYSTGASLNWTSEFALDVTHAAQERGYPVLYHFCEFLHLINNRLVDGPSGTSATATILKYFLCLFRLQCLSYIEFDSLLSVDDLDARAVASLDSAQTFKRFQLCLQCFKPGTVLYIVIDSANLLEEWTRGRTKDWLEEISSLENADNIVIKLLFTSLSSAQGGVNVFAQWKEHRETTRAHIRAAGHSQPAVRRDISPFKVLSVTEDKGSSSNQALVRLLRSPSKPAKFQQSRAQPGSETPTSSDGNKGKTKETREELP